MARWPDPSDWPSWLRLDGLRSKKLVVGVAGGATLLLVTFLAVPRMAYSKVVERAAERGVVINRANISARLFGVNLSDVDVALEGIPGLTVHLDEVTVPLDLGLHPTELRLEGAKVAFSGTLDELVHSLEDFRARHASKTTEPAESKGGLPLDFSKVELRINHPESALELSGGTLVRKEDKLVVGFDLAAFEKPSARLEAKTAQVEIRGKKIANLSLATLAYQFRKDPKQEKAEKKEADEKNADKNLEKGEPPSPDAVPLSLPKTFSFGDVSALRATLDRVAVTLGEKLTSDAKGTVGTLTLRAADGRALGEGKLALARTESGAGVALTFSTSAAASNGSTPLTFDARLEPNVDAKIQLKGGPIRLRALGIAEGAAGLIDTDRTELSVEGTVVLSGAGDTLSVDGDATIKNMGIALPRLARDPVHGLDLHAKAKAIVSRLGELRIEAAEVALGALRVVLKGSAKASEELAADLSFELPKTSCDVLLQSLPPQLVPDLAGVRLTGEFGMRGATSFRTTHLDDLVLDVRTSDSCRFVELPSLLKKDRFEGPFLHRVYTPELELVEQEMGPGTENWSPLEEISPFMQAAVLTTEDGAFPHHHGFSTGAVKNSLIANLKAGKFIRGASTISMQLSKNLFLVRDKTLSRKLEEVVLTDYLESSFTKDEMMELYLNVIEFGPNVYGITSAAEHYFGKTAKDLSLLESMFLSSMLPKPSKGQSVIEKGLPDYWLRTLHSYIRTAQKTGKVSLAEATAALAEKLTFHPGEAVTHSKFSKGSRADEDTDWKPIRQ